MVKRSRDAGNHYSQRRGLRRKGSGALVSVLMAGLLLLVVMLTAGCSAKQEAPGPSRIEPSESGGDALNSTSPPQSTTASLGRGGIHPLPSARLVGDMTLEEAIAARRSIRDYTGQPVTLAEVGQLLWAAQGITSERGARSAPSAGGTYPLEVYLVAGDVEGLPPGVYRYRPKSHDLMEWSAEDRRAALAVASLNQAWVRTAAVDVVITAVYARTTQTYGERGVRYVHLEAGHAAQNLCLQAVALGLGSVVVGAFYDEEVQRVLELPADHEPLYVIPVGRPASL
jgi:SagB-type dehydrogenase family enzyme